MQDALNSYLILFIVAGVTAFTRAIPFLLLSGRNKLPNWVYYLSNTLPATIMIILVIYSLRNIDLSHFPFGLPELAAAGLTILLQFWKKNTILSMTMGTIVYMVLIRMLSGLM
ncbi:MAG: AzlD domain-containing protein [Tissierellia bacterium]|nr:AzlD domain-containing protein [Tissierellia bacterium]